MGGLGKAGEGMGRRMGGCGGAVGCRLRRESAFDAFAVELEAFSEDGWLAAPAERGGRRL